MKKNALLTIFACLVFANFGCDKCEDIACFSPPPEFNFQLLDKDNGEDLVANGTFKVGEVSVFSIAENKKHTLQVTTDSTTYTFTDTEIRWITGSKNTSYELRLNPNTVFPFTYESKEKQVECCTSFELVAFDIAGVERLFILQSNLFQMRI